MAKYRKYSKEFKLQAAKLVTEQGYSYDKAAKRLGTTGFSVRNWVQKFRGSGDLPAQTSAYGTKKQFLKKRCCTVLFYPGVFYFPNEIKPIRKKTTNTATAVEIAKPTVSVLSHLSNSQSDFGSSFR